MPSLVAKTVAGHKYWQIVESRRVNGQPRSFVVMHLGRPDDLLRRLQRLEQDRRISSVAYGPVAALWSLAREYGLAALIDAEIPRDRRRRLPHLDGLTPGTSLVLAALGRACKPTSKRGWADWARTTSLPRLAGVDAARLTSQHFWDQMHRVPVDALARIEEKLVREVVRREGVAADALLYDTTNFYTFIASDNQHCALPQRGHNKQKRHDLRQLGLGLVVSRDGQLPLFHLVYEGGRPDVRTFPKVLTSLRERLLVLFGTAPNLTLVYDKGNNSRANQAQVDEGPCHYVGSLVPTAYPDLLAEANERMHDVALPGGQQVRAFRVRRKLWDQERTLLVIHSELLYRGQVRGVQQQLHKRLRLLQRIADKLEGPRGGRGQREKLEARVADILRGQHMRDLLQVEIRTTAAGRLQLSTRVNEEHYQHLLSFVFGKRILMTDHHDWSDADIILAYRGQAAAERAFRELKDPGQLAVRPTFHWTDQKLRVHVFCCVLAFLLLKLLQRRARRAGVDLSLRALMAQLGQLREATIIDTSAEAGRPRVRRQLEEVDDGAKRLAAALGLPTTSSAPENS